jgi:hypothetical protein
MDPMNGSAAVRPRIEEDPVSNVLKWILIAVAVGSFALFAWATVLTYERAAPQPDRYLTAGGATVMTNNDIIAGKAVNAVIIKRFAKRQRMQCTKRGICVIDAAGRIMREVKVASEPEATLRMESL